MAFETKGTTVGNIAAGADLRTQQYRFVTLDATGRWVLSAAAAAALGVLQNAPNTGEPAEVQLDGVTKLIVNAGATVALGAAVTPGAAAGGATAAATNNILGRRCAGDGGGAGAAGTIVSVLLGYGGLQA